MSYESTSAKLAEYRREIAAIRQKMRAAQAGVEPRRSATTGSRHRKARRSCRSCSATSAT